MIWRAQVLIQGYPTGRTSHPSLDDNRAHNSGFARGAHSSMPGSGVFAHLRPHFLSDDEIKQPGLPPQLLGGLV